jgi:hypothetical protein
MIYQNFLFIHIPKCGGSSIEKAFMGDHKHLNFTIKHIFTESRFSNFIVSSMRNRDWRIFVFWLVSFFMCDLKNLWGLYRGKVLQHLTYQEIMTNKKFHQNKKLIKFTIIRNPYDRIISAYHFLGKNLTFKHFVYWVYQELDNYYRKNVKPFVVILPQWEFLVDELGKIRIPHLIKFENLNEEFKKFCDKYKLKLDLPHINKRVRNKKILEYYDQELADMVYHIYRWDFKLLKFKKLIFRKSTV